MPSGARIAGLMYHEVTDDPASTGFQRASALHYAHSYRGFAEHLDAIAASPLRPELVSGVDLATPGEHLLLTFDDGGKSAQYAADQLARRGWRAHFFIVTGHIGERTFLSRDGIRELRSAGHLVGSHSHTHPDIFRDLSHPAMLEEWRRSTGILEEILMERCAFASVPGGDISPEVLQSGIEAGFSHVFTSEPWLTPGRIGDCWIIGRLCVKAETPARTIERLLRFRGWYSAQVSRRIKDMARLSLGPLYRRYVTWTTRPFTAPGA